MASGDRFLPHLGLIQKLVFKVLISQGYFPVEESEELVHRVLENLLLREEMIINSFQGRAKFTTYLSVIIINICREIRDKLIRQRQNNISLRIFPGLSELSYYFEKIPDRTILPDDSLIIYQYVKKLHLIFLTYGDESMKLVICLKAFSGIRLDPGDVDLVHLPPDESAKATEIIERINEMENGSPRKELFQMLSRLFFITENKSQSSEALRKWIEYYKKQFILILNGNPPHAAFTMETFDLLFEYYCCSGNKFSPFRKEKPSKCLSGKTT